MTGPVRWQERHRAGEPRDYVRDDDGRFAETPGGGGAPKMLAVGDKLNVARRIKLGPGETLVGSASIPYSGVIGAAVDSPSGRKVRLGLGIDPTDMRKWSGANKGSTVVLDESAIDDLRTAIAGLPATGAEGKRREAVFAKRERELKAREDKLVARQYPGLTAAETKELSSTNRKLDDIDRDLTWQRRHQRERLDRLPSAADRERVQLLDEKLIQSALDNADSPRPVGENPEPWNRERYRLLSTDPEYAEIAAQVYARDAARINELLVEQRDLRGRVAELTANPVALSPTDAADLQQVRADIVDNDNQWGALNDDFVLAGGSVPGEWGSVQWQASWSDGEPSYKLAIAADGYAGWAFEHFDTSELKQLTALLDKLAAQPSQQKEGTIPMSWNLVADLPGGIAQGDEAAVAALLAEATEDIDVDDDRFTEAVEAAVDVLFGDEEPDEELDDEPDETAESWDASAHPRAAAGAAGGGQFATSGGSAPAKKAAPAKGAPTKKGAPAKTTARKRGETLSYDPKTGRGAGYGKKGGDTRVRKLQDALNRLGLKDADGRALKVDGKLGPRTTAAVKAAQRKLGVPADGKVTPELLVKLVAMKAAGGKPAGKPKTTTRHHTAAKRPAKAPAKKAAPAAKAKAPVQRRVTRGFEAGAGDKFIDDLTRAVAVRVGESVTEAAVLEDAEIEATDRIEGRILEGLGEDDAGNRVFRVRIISAGDSKNGRRYPANVLESAASLYEGAKAYDHHRTPAELASSTIAGMVGYYRNVAPGDGGLDADLVLLRSAGQHTAEALDASIAAQADGLTPLVGISHDAMTFTRPIVVGGRRLQEATRITKVNSADVVADPAAGGKATRVLAGGIEPEESKESDVAVTATDVLAALKTASDDELAAVGLQRSSEATELEPEGLDKASFLGGLMIEKKVSAAGLPAKVVESLTEELPDRITEADVDARVASLKSILGVAERAGLAPTATATVTQESIDKKVGALDAFFAGDFSKGYRSFKQAYLDLTGYRQAGWDEDLNRRIMRESIGDLYDSADRSTESLTSTSWNLVLGDSITRRLVAQYAHPSLQSWRQIVSSTIPVNDFRTQRIDRVGGYGTLPTVNQGAPYQPLTSPGNEEVTYSLTKRGGTEDLTLEMIANDDVRAISNIPNKLGLAAARTLHNFVWDFILTNPTIYDSVALFHATHSNTTAVALGQSNLSTVRAKMRDQTSYGDTSDILSLVPKFLIVPNELEELAFQLTTSAVAIPSTPAGASNTPNLHQGMQPIVLDYDTDANDWFVVADPDMCPTIEVGFYQGRQEPELFTQSDPTVGSMFNADTLTYKIRHIYSGAVLDYRGFQRATQ